MRTRATAAVVKDEKLLMIHRHNHGEEYWVLPGGGVEEDENLESAVLRELNEETSIVGKTKEKILDFIDSKDDRHVLFSVEYVSGKPVLHADSEEANSADPEQSYNPEWVGINKLPELVIYPKEEKDFLIEYLK